MSIDTLSPGAYVIAEDEETSYFISEYSEKSFSEVKHVFENEIVLSGKGDKFVTWIHAVNYRNENFLEIIKERYKLHSLTIEDIVKSGQRFKYESYDDYDVVFLQIPEGEIFKQLSIIFTKTQVISFGESRGLCKEVSDFILDRIRTAKGRIRRKKSDYLAYCLADCVFDLYFKRIENLENRIENLDDDIAKNPSPAVLEQIRELKKEMTNFKKTVWPMREMVQSIQKSDSKFIEKGTQIFIRDLYDHAVRIRESAESLREQTIGLNDQYISSTGMKTNESVKMLTILSTIFVPLTFITSVYGMNFEIAEVKYAHGYAMIWVVMIVITVSLLWWFKKKKWI